MQLLCDDVDEVRQLGTGLDTSTASVLVGIVACRRKEAEENTTAYHHRLEPIRQLPVKVQ